MNDFDTHYARLRQVPSEWRKRGLMDPTALEALVAARVNGGPNALAAMTGEPTYADFFSTAQIAIVAA